MTQLSYQPAFDPFHTVFRILRLFQIIEKYGPLHRDAVRILDFFLLFPFRLEAIRLKREHGRFRKFASVYLGSKPYGDQPDDKTVFDRMAPMQEAALETLALRGLLDGKQLTLGLVEVSGQPSPELAERIAAANLSDADLLQFLATLASEYDVMGPDGLKARTKLLEYRYDAL